jgi:protein-S-isoprenylcysteine O-methyltransferase Ste14
MTALPVSTPETATPGLALPRPGTKFYDFLFGLPLAIWYGIGMYVQAPLLVHAVRALAAPHANPFAVIDILAKSAALLFAAVLIGLVVLRRPATSGAPGFLPKAVAFLGAFLGVLILCLPHQKIGWQLQLLSTVMIVSGTGFSIYALVWLGRSISVLSEARTLVTGGPYAFVRHPLYLGEETALIGLTLQFLSPMAVGVLLMQIGFQLYRMGYEEQVLTRAFPEYLAYAVRVKRILPGIY